MRQKVAGKNVHLLTAGRAKQPDDQACQCITANPAEIVQKTVAQDLFLARILVSSLSHQ